MGLGEGESHECLSIASAPGCKDGCGALRLASKAAVRLG
jgi:hypothetical protein